MDESTSEPVTHESKVEMWLAIIAVGVWVAAIALVLIAGGAVELKIDSGF